MMLIFGLLEALEMEALVDAMDVDNEYLLEKFRHHHHHRVDEMTCLDDERMRKRRNDVPCHDYFEVIEFVLGQEDA
ncbi:hypothetical protein Tco_0512608 [Tanacetum coccineum]